MQLDWEDAARNLARIRDFRGGTYVFDITNTASGYMWGAHAVGNYYETGQPVANPRPSNRYFWTQYIKEDVSETENVPNANVSFYGPTMRTPGRWYLDVAQIDPRFGNVTPYGAQQYDENHKLVDVPLDRKRSAFAQVRDPRTGQMVARPVIEIRNNVPYLVWGLAETKQDVINREIDEAKKKVNGQDFIAGYAHSFQSYIVRAQGTIPIGYYTWGWAVHVDTVAKTMTVTDVQPTGNKGQDAAVWNKVGPS